jgi:hypothetical protein
MIQKLISVLDNFYNILYLQVTIGGYTITLQALDVASISSASYMSGRLIRSNRPVAVISGNMCGETVCCICDYESVSVNIYCAIIYSSDR